ncbi:MAG: EamA family transporter RarD [Desulfarculales bacterium]|nr:EamA family transporter RarD [Desulfarculales bacterium]
MAEANSDIKPPGGDSAVGLWSAVGAYALWGFLVIYWKELGTVPALEIMLHRLWWSFLLLVVYLLFVGKLRQSLKALRSLRVTLTLLGSGLLISCNWLLFIWAANDGQILATSLGYFLVPILNMVCGLVLFKDRLNRTQWLAVILAVMGVAVELAFAGRLPWVSLVLAVSFTAYGVLRKTVPVGAVTGLFIETMLLAPLALTLLLSMGLTDQLAFGGAGHKINTMLAMSGLVTTVPLLMFAHGTRNLRLTTLGLVQYLSPLSSMVLGIFLYGEELSLGMMFSFSFIWLGLCVYTWGSLRQHYRFRPAGRKR